MEIDFPHVRQKKTIPHTSELSHSPLFRVIISYSTKRTIFYGMQCIELKLGHIYHKDRNDICKLFSCTEGLTFFLMIARVLWLPIEVYRHKTFSYHFWF